MKQSTLKKEPILSENTNSTSSNYELIKRTDVKDSPFTIITIKDRNESYVVMGSYRLTDGMTFEECKDWCDEITWNKLVQVMIVLSESSKNMKL